MNRDSRFVTEYYWVSLLVLNKHHSLSIIYSHSSSLAKTDSNKKNQNIFSLILLSGNAIFGSIQSKGFRAFQSC